MKKVDMILSPLEIFNNEEYNLMDKVRFENFDKLNIDFKDKKILELGAGIGNHTKFLLDKNPKSILTIEGRKENFNILKEKYPQTNPILADLEKPLKNIGFFDWIYNYGLLYHLANPFEAIDNLRFINHNNMILETCIDITGSVNNIKEGDSPSQALNGIGSRPNLELLMEKLTKFYKSVVIPEQPKHHYYEQFKRIVIVCYENNQTTDGNSTTA